MMHVLCVLRAAVLVSFTSPQKERERKRRRKKEEEKKKR